MTALDSLQLVVASIAFCAAMTHCILAVALRKDPTHVGLAIASSGFFLFALGAALVDTADSSTKLLLWLGVGIGTLLISIGVPMVAWLLMELPFTLTRKVFLGAVTCIGLARVVELTLRAAGDPSLTWEAAFRVPGPVGILSSFGALAIASEWTVEGVLAIRAGRPFARSLAGFGVFSVFATVQGVGVALHVLDGPALFSLAGLPFIAFVEVVTALKHARAIEDANKPSGDFERYQVLEKLGEGGMGEVFLARRRGPAGFLRDVVLKMLKAKLDDAELRGHFLSEARLAAQLRHPNIVDVYDLGEQPGGFFIVMEHIGGPTLSDVLAAKPQLPPDVAAEIGVQLCRALDFAHASGVIHRDLKQQNVMLSPAGMVKLIDFGIAQEQASAPATESHVAGTHGFISPERLYGGPASPASDLFSVGVVLYLMLTGEYPYPQPGTLDFIAAVKERTAARLATVRPDCPEALLSAVEQCLAFEPSARPASAAELGVQLERAVHGKRVDLRAFIAATFPNGVVPARSMAVTTPARVLTVPGTAPTVNVRGMT